MSSRSNRQGSPGVSHAQSRSAPSLAWNAVWILPGPTENIEWGTPGTRLLGRGGARVGGPAQSLSSLWPQAARLFYCCSWMFTAEPLPPASLVPFPQCPGFSPAGQSSRWAALRQLQDLLKGQCPVSPRALVRESPALVDRAGSDAVT